MTKTKMVILNKLAFNMRHLGRPLLMLSLVIDPDTGKEKEASFQLKNPVQLETTAICKNRDSKKQHIILCLLCPVICSNNHSSNIKYPETLG